MKRATKKILIIYPFLLLIILYALFIDSWTKVALVLPLLFIFFPWILVKLWRCPPLPENELKFELESLAKRGKFKHGGFYEWRPMNHMLTAAIVGAVFPFRYVLFSAPLLRRLSDKGLLAILAHEMGHAYWCHLFIYPFLLLGGMLASFQVIEIMNIQSEILFYIWFFIFFALYIRFIVGFFSRLFERQADSYGVRVGISIDDSIETLYEVGHLAGGTHDKPNWHHYSLNERIRFLESVKNNPKIVLKHDLKTKLYVILYFILLLVLCCLVYGMD